MRKDSRYRFFFLLATLGGFIVPNRSGAFP